MTVSRIKKCMSCWGLVVACHVAIMLSAGIHISVLVLVDDIATALEASTGVVGWVCGMYGIFFGLSAPLTSYALNTFSICTVITAGGLLVSAGVLLIAFSYHVIFVCVGFAVLAGIGVGVVFTATTAVVREWYTNHRYAFAHGATITGVSTSVFIFPPIIKHWSFVFGWRGALLVTSAIALNTLVFAALIGLIVAKRKRVTIVSKDGEKMTKLKPPLVNRGISKSATGDLESTLVYAKGGTVSSCSFDEEVTTHCDIKELRHVRTIKERSVDAPMASLDDEYTYHVYERLSLDMQSGHNQERTSHATSKGIVAEDQSKEMVERHGEEIKADLSTEESFDVDGSDRTRPNSVADLNKNSGFSRPRRKLPFCKVFELSSQPLSRSTLSCYRAQFTSIFFAAASYFTGTIYMSAAGTSSGLSPMEAASLLSAFGISQAVARFCMGMFVSKGFITGIRLYTTLHITQVLSLVLLGLLMRVYVVALLGALCLGLSAGGIISLHCVVQRDIDAHANSVSLGWLYFMDGLGGFLGSLALGSLEDVTGGFLMTFLVAAGCTATSVGLCVYILRHKKRKQVKHRAPKL